MSSVRLRSGPPPRTRGSGCVRQLIGPLLGPTIDLVVDLTDDPAGQVTVGAQMEQVPLNLIANARDAMPDGGRLTLTTDVRGLDSAPGAGTTVTLLLPAVASG